MPKFLHSINDKRLFWGFVLNKQNKNSFFSLLLFFLLYLPSILFAEGSKEIWIDNYSTGLYLCSDFISHCNGGAGDRTQFAVYNSDSLDRLYFVVDSTVEKVYIGFQGHDPSGIFTTRKIVYRIKDINGNIVKTEADLPTSGIGYINNITEAREGPQQLNGGTGYDALVWDPPAVGIYYMEFQRMKDKGSTWQVDPGAFRIDLFDITVADTVTLEAKTGRVYSYAWQFNSYSGFDMNNCSATFYVYSTDSITTSLTLNDMSGGVWFLYCNQTGVGNSGDWMIDRQSINGEGEYTPQYRIFLNEPDTNLFPPASTLGSVIGTPWGQAHCDDGTIDFHVTVDKTGNVDINLDFNPPYVDRTISSIVSSGENIITWDGNDGNGTPVPNNENIIFTVSYINGLTNLPLYDVESNDNGFSINIVTPLGATPLVYWDDTLVGGGSNFTGCSGAGCHPWSDGDLYTMNTWWYNVSTTTTPVTIVEQREPDTLVFDQVPPQSYCAGVSGITFSVADDPNTERYYWSYTGNDVSIYQVDTSDNFITVDFGPNATSGDIQVYGTNNNCSNPGPTSSLAILINALPIATISISPNDTVCVNENVYFTGTDSAGTNITNWDWDFADGNTGSGQTPTHTYLNVLDDSVRLIATNDGGCVDTTYKHIWVEDPSINFTISPNPACLNDTIYFDGTGDTVTYADWDWNFGDGNTTVGRNVSHSYATYDTFNVVLNVCSKSVSQQLIVNQPAHANAGSDATLCESHPYDFATSSTLPVASGYDSLKWFGGIGTFSDPNILLPVYTPGNGEVGPIILRLIAYGTLPCGNDTSAMTLTLDSLPDPGFYTLPADSICVSESVTFIDTSNTDITSWQWDFDDGNISNLQQPVHAFSTDGMFAVKLIVTNNNACTDSITQVVQVHPLPQPDFTILPNDTVCAEIPLNFSAIDSAGTNITEWNWNFGDGTTGSGQNIVHTYTSLGDYTITLNVLNDNSCSGNISKSVHVNSLPLADFTISPNDTSCMGEVVNFDGIPITTDITNWQWEFGDGDNATGQNVNHTYNQAGIFNVLSIYSNANGCIDTTIHQRVVQDISIDFAMIPSPTCQDYTVNFAGTGDNITFTDWNWDFGDGSAIAVGHDVSHIYTQADTVNVILNVCSQQVVHALTINGTAHVDAGTDEATCQDVYFDLSTSSTPPSGNNYDSIRWYGGQGTFNDPTLLAPVYTPDSSEGSIQIDTLILTMVGYGIAPCDNDTSQMTLLVVPGAYAQAGSDENSCFNEPYDFANSSLVPFATNYAYLYWSTDGTGHFVDSTVEVPIYIPGPNELGPVTLTMVAANIINCDSIDSMVLTIRPTYEIPFDTTVCFYDSAFAQGQWRYISGTYYDTLQSIYSCDSVIVTNLTVRPKVDKNFTINTSDSICFEETVNFTMTGSANLSSWLWDFGDGNTSTEVNPQHQYILQGTHLIVFRYTDSNGCSDSTTRLITVFPLPDVSFVANMETSCVNTQIDFLGNSSSNIVSWQWDFGDGQNGLGQNVSHVYSSWGDMTVVLTVTDIDGCSQTASQMISIAQPPIADFSYRILVCDTLQFTDLSSAAPGYNLVMWHWDFGDGDTSNLQNPIHAYAQGGLYYVTLLVTADSSGFMCIDTITKPVNAPLHPDVFFTFTPDPTCLGDTTFFHGTSGFPINVWHWDFDDGYFTTDSIVTHLYADTGIYNVILSIVDTNGCTNSLTHQVSVTPLPDVSITLSDSILCQGGEVICTGASSDTIASWYWDFGDGSFSIGQNASHYYTQGGTYILSLMVTDTGGCSNTAIKSILVSPSPTADFSSSVIACTQFAFTDLSTAPAGYNLTGWNWDFGDGTTSTVQNPIHMFPSTGGLYNVRLIVTADSSGYSCNDTTEQGVMVPGQPPVFFNWDPEPTMLGNVTSFYGTSGNSVVSWYWDFGDGTFSTAQNPQHTFATIGTFDVQLSIIDMDSCTNNITHQVSVVSVPGLDFYWDASCENAPVQFHINDTVTDINAVVSWYWDFGDGGSSTEMEPQHTFPSAGAYDVSLTIVDTMNATNTVVKVVTVNPPPTVVFNYDEPNCEGNATQFHDFSTPSTGFLIAWIWDFGDGNDTTVYFPGNPDVSHTYANAGTFTVMLTVVNSDSCGGRGTNNISIEPGPLALFTHSEGCASLPINFTDQSQTNGGATIISWEWNFGDPASGIANTSTLQNPSHLFSSGGSYDVLLQITNANGCTDTTHTQVNVGDNPGVDFSFSDACFGSETQFTVDTTVTNTGEVATYLWDFGDGSTSNLPNPTHIYGNSGNYTATLTIITIDSCSASIQHTVSIRPLPNSNFDQTAPACFGDTVFFTNFSSSPNGIIVTWQWDFGDGDTVTIHYPDNPNVSHLYGNTSTFAVILTVTDTTGCQNSVTHQIEIVANPVADFTYQETCYGEPVIYTDLSTPNGGVDLSQWEWFFGDPLSGIYNHSDLQNPTHIYTEPGTYTTTLIVTSTLGCTDTTEQDITVDSLPAVDFTMDDDSICLGEEAVFTGIGSDINTWFWKFGDGGTSIEQNPTYMYAAAGLYTVTLTVTGIDQCQNSVSHQIFVNEAPIAGFEYQNTCLRDTTYFTDVSVSQNGYIVSWDWNFGDPASGVDNTSTQQDPVHYYATNDNYLVMLLVTDNFGCMDTITQWVQVFDTPNPNFTYNQACEPVGQVYFSDSSTPGEEGSPIQAWKWNLYEGYYSTEINPGYIYPQTDTCYTISLEITDANGCTAIDTSQVCLFGTITTDFTATEECLGKSTFFQSSYAPQNDSVASYTWDFHDGSNPVSTYHDTISHVFPNPGTFLVELIAQDTNGCSYNAYHEIIVDSLPTPQFEYVAGLCNNPTQFTDRSFGGGNFIQSWNWDFDDVASGASNYSTLQNPVHQYGPQDSVYQVKLIVTNFNGCVDSVVEAVSIAPCLIADFVLPTGNNCARTEVCFTETSQLSSNNGSLTLWEWDFGDGNTTSYSTRQNPVCHTYQMGGDYEVQLVITATIGANTYTDTLIKQLTINPTPVAGITVINNCLGDTTWFYDNTQDNGAPLSRWHWDFGTPATGDTSIEQNPTYVYPTYGTFDIELITGNAFSCIDSTQTTVTVYKPPVAGFDFDSTCMSYFTYFTDVSVGDSSAINSWQWSFGDTLSKSDTSMLQNPTHIYDTTGYYMVQLVTGDGNSCSDTSRQQIRIYPLPTAVFNIIDDYNQRQGQISLVNTSKNAGTYFWDFDNGMTSTEKSPVYQYEEDGKYNIMLVAYNSYNCPDTTTEVYDLLFTGLFVPNAFIPSGTNDALKTFKPIGINLKRYTLEVYSGWGNLLFKTTLLEDGRPAQGWDGTYEGQDMPTGTYLWRISAQFKDGTYWRGSDNGDGNIQTNGTVTLIR